MHSTVVLLHVCVDSQSSSHGSFESSKRRWLDFVGFAKTFHVVKLPSVLETRGGESQVFNPQWGSFWECWEDEGWFERGHLCLLWTTAHVTPATVSSGNWRSLLDERWTSSQTQRSPVIIVFSSPSNCLDNISWRKCFQLFTILLIRSTNWYGSESLYKCGLFI